MPSLQWIGEQPRGALRTALEGLGAKVAPEPEERPFACVISTADTRQVPRGAAEGIPWLWLSAAPVRPELVTQAVLAGAYDVVSLAAGNAAARLVARLRELTVEMPIPADKPPFVVESEAARGILAQLAQAARTSMPVLLTGETGTGKELAARLIHDWSTRRDKRFVAINCAAIPNELMEGELFGYAKGAFSGAVRAYDGQLMAAEGGTVFLDEIDDTPMSLQIKLLRVLEDRIVNRLGENEWHKVDFRIMAATNRDLRKLIAAGTFLPDLYERFAIVSVQLPPLRERLADLPAMLAHFIERFYREEPSARLRAEVKHVSPEALAALASYPWPGNIRELRNVVFGALVYKRAGDELLLSDLPKRILRRGEEKDGAGGVVNATALAHRLDTGALNLRQELENLERLALSAALERTQGNATQAARLLGEVGRGSSRDPGGTVRAMMRRLGLGGAEDDAEAPRRGSG